MKTRKKTPEEISFEYFVQDNYRHKNKRETFVLGYNHAMKQKFISNSILLIILLFVLVFNVIVFSVLLYGENS